MISWLSEQIASLSPPKEEGPHAATKALMKEVLACEAVLSPAKELEYKYLMEQVCRATFDIDDRVIVMDFLHYSLAPVDAGREWRTIFNGLRVVDALIDSGSSAVFAEVSEGKHFDLLQKTLFLLSYAHSDERIGKLIRTAAKEIRDKLLVKFDQLDNPEEPEDQPNVTCMSSKDTVRHRPVIASSIAHVVSLRHIEESSDEEPCAAAPSIPADSVHDDLIDVDQLPGTVMATTPLGPVLTVQNDLIDVHQPSGTVTSTDPLLEL